VFAICGHTNALVIWAFYPETTGRRLEEMDDLFKNAPIFVPGTSYAKLGDRFSSEKELLYANPVKEEFAGHIQEVIEDQDDKLSVRQV